MDLNDVLQHALAAVASDVHLKLGQPPVFRTDGELAPAADFGPLGDAELEAVLDEVTVSVPRRRELFDESGDLDLAYSAPGLPRFRVKDNNTAVWSPVITRSTTINNSALINAPTVPIEWMCGLPSATQTVTEVNPVQGSYAG